jgi:GTP-binding protein Era
MNQMNENNQNGKKKLYVSLLGKPNSGKSSIINAIVNKKVSAVSNKPNTTIQIVRGVYVKDNVQIVFLDTPGISYKIGSSRKNEIAKSTISSCSMNIFCFPVNEMLDKHLLALSKFIEPEKKIALITKIDKLPKLKLLPLTEKLAELVFSQILYISILHKDGIKELENFLVTKSETGEWEFNSNNYTELGFEERIKEATREVLFNTLYKELPYEIIIRNGEIRQNEKQEYVIYQFLDFKQNAHHIVLGKIKEISMAAAVNMKAFLNEKKTIHLYIKLIDSSKKHKR